MKRVFISITILLTILNISCSKDNGNVIKLGAVTPLTGPISTYGENIRDGILLAVDEINKSGGIDGGRIKIIFEDEGDGPRSAVNSVRKLININNVQAIIGPATSDGVLAAAPIAEKNKTVLLSPSATSNNIREAGDYIFRNRASASQEASIFTEYIISELNVMTFGVLRADADYALSFIEVCRNVIDEKGGQILIEEVFNEGSTDYRSQLSKIKALSPQGIFIIGVPSELGIILNQINELGIKSRLFSNTIDSPQIFKIAEGAAEGLTFVTTFYDPNYGGKYIKEFDNKFKKEYGRASHIFGANAYDAVYLLKTAIETHGRKGEQIKEGLYDIENFNGAAGITEFDNKGDLKFTKVAIKKISEGEFKFIKEVQK